MKIKELTTMMEYLHNEVKDMEAYNELWESVKTLGNLGLIGRNVIDAMIKKDHELFLNENK